MSEVKIVPITYLNRDRMASLMLEEEGSWMSELGWDYAAIRLILLSFIDQRLLPGYAATDGDRALGYTYFLVHQTRGIIGAVYTSEKGCSQELAEELLSLTVTSLKDAEGLQRIEAQIMPFGSYNLTPTFTQHGFRSYLRYFLNLDLATYDHYHGNNSGMRIVEWDSDYLQSIAEVVFRSYRNQTDALICEDYCTVAGCKGYLRSLIENPGCGIFVPDATLVALDSSGVPCGIVMCSRISTSIAMIPQIATHPSYQGHGVGNALAHEAFSRLRAMGYDTVTLTVTRNNVRAFEWYRRLGFEIHRQFYAYTWERCRSSS
jgi:ribosomal protein S18 acetylase RimI-like enzyme